MFTCSSELIICLPFTNAVISCLLPSGISVSLLKLVLGEPMEEAGWKHLPQHCVWLRHCDLVYLASWVSWEAAKAALRS